ncbi:hypothetical protein [uncultured Clostridium sp.]|uniref:phage tail protein n=1 Tax=uncultured Clostridium sp. TaxID=59620 RepID=UPI0025FE7B30|nr:hypothetical protein [uncultured Clostridium sp.]
MADRMTLEVEVKILEDPVKMAAENLKSKFKSLVSELNDITSGIKYGFLSVSDRIVEIAGDMGGEYSNKISNISSTWESVSEGILEKFKEPMGKVSDIVFNVVSEIADYLNSADVQGIIDEIVVKTNEVIDVAGKVIDEILPIILDGLGWIVENSEVIIAGIAGIGAAFLTFEVVSLIVSVIETLQVFQEAIVATGSIMEAFNIICEANPYAIIAAAIVGVVTALVVLWNTSEGFREVVTGIFESIGEVMSSVWNALVTFFTETIPSAFQSLCDFFAGIPEWFSNLWGLISEVFSTGWKAVVDFFTEQIPAWLESIWNWFNKLPEYIGYALGYALGKVIEFGANCINWIVNDLPGIISGIIDWFRRLPGNIWNFLCDIVSIVKGIGVGFEIEMPNLNKITEGKIGDMTKRIKAAVQLETSKVCSNVVGGQMNGMFNSSITNNDNGIVQNITINQPVKSPSETARAIRRAGRDLAFG